MKTLTIPLIVGLSLIMTANIALVYYLRYIVKVYKNEGLGSTYYSFIHYLVQTEFNTLISIASLLFIDMSIITFFIF